MIGKILGIGTAARHVGDAVGDVARVFAGDRAAREAAEHERYVKALGQFSEEFAHPGMGWFDQFVNGLNRLPRPTMAVGTLGLFVYAMVEPQGFATRMQGLAFVPEPLWWLLGAVVSFYFGARELHHYRGRKLDLPLPPTVPEASTPRSPEALPPPEASPPPLPAPPSATTPVAVPEAPHAMAPVTATAPPDAAGDPADPHHNAAFEDWRRSRAA
jgi:hypothetical protein